MASGVQNGCTGGLANGELEGPLRRSYSSVPFVQVYTGPGGSDSDLPLWPTPDRLWWPIPMNILPPLVPDYTPLGHEGVPRTSGILCVAWLLRLWQ